MVQPGSGADLRIAAYSSESDSVAYYSAIDIMRDFDPNYLVGLRLKRHGIKAKPNDKAKQGELGRILGFRNYLVDVQFTRGINTHQLKPLAGLEIFVMKPDHRSYDCFNGMRPIDLIETYLKIRNGTGNLATLHYEYLKMFGRDFKL